MSKEVLREKIAEYGLDVDKYTIDELLAIATDIDPDAFKGVHTVTAARKIIVDPIAVRGIGRQKAIQLRAVQRLAEYLANPLPESDIIRGPEDVAKFVMPRLRFATKEKFCVMSLTTQNQVIAIDEVSIGSLSASVVHPREVFTQLIEHHAGSGIVIHNHPSGRPEPSREDMEVTARLVKAGRVMDIPICDHVIIGDNNYVSLKKRGLIE